MNASISRTSYLVLSLVLLIGGGCTTTKSPEQASIPSTNTTTQSDAQAPQVQSEPTSTKAAVSEPTTQAAPNKPAVAPIKKPQAQPTQPTPKTVTVTIVDHRFSPLVIAINKGDQLIWANNDLVPHTTTSDGTLLWDSGTIRPGGTYKRIFPATGTYQYHCGIHPDMQATVIVR